jgi:two-component system phosphate regulon sensor histidine kinase PhoR
MTGIGIGIAAAALLVAIALVVRRAGARSDARILDLRAVVDALGAGRLDTRAPIEAHDDAAALGRSLNEFAASVKARLAEADAERATRDAVLESLPHGIALLSSDLAIRHANRTFWSLVDVEPPAEPSPHLAIARQPALEEIAAEAVRGGRAVIREVSLYVKERTDVEVAISPVRGGAPAAWLLTIASLRPEREMAALRREFVANASHELKTPLTSIRGYAETLLSGGLEDAENRTRFVETIRAQAMRLEALVEDLLELADLDRPDAELDLKDWDLGAVLRDACAPFEELARRRGLRFGLEIRPGVRARCDRKRIELALGNLLDNAVKYSDAGRVLVRLEPSPGAARVSVTDTGRGIAEEHLPRVFERFYRVDRGRSRALGGTGLGLAILKHAIQLHGGQVGVESRLGEGSTFWFEIPAEGPKDRDATGRVAAPPAP